MPSTSARHSHSDIPDKSSVANALELFELNPPFSLETLKDRNEELLLAWHPHRNANLTNNPTKYMQMYKKGEAKTKEVRAAFRILMDWLHQQNASSNN